MSESELNSRRYGLFQSDTGPVYTEFDINRHVIEPFSVPFEWQDCLSIDPGLKNPLSCHFYAVDYDGNIYVLAEHYESGLSVEEHAKKIKDIADRIGWRKGSDGKLKSLIDSAANQKTLAGIKSVSELFYDNGINVNSNVDKDLFTGINRVKSYFKNDRLFIFKNCVNLIRELKSYRWGDGDLPVKKDDHALDELRYYVMTKPKLTQLPPKKTDVLKKKEQLIRRLSRKKYG
jgi:hypothetical protein